MPVLEFLPFIIGAGSKLIGGAKKPTSTSSSTTTANLDPAQAALHAQLADILKNALASGPNVPGWQKNAAAGQINAGYAQALPKLEQQLASRGFESSGKLGSTMRGLEIGRVNALSQSHNQLAQGAQSRYDEMLRLAQQFTNPTGHTTNSSTTGSSGLGGAIEGIGGDVSTMLLLRNLFKNAGGGSSSNWDTDTGDWGQEFG